MSSSSQARGKLPFLQRLRVSIGFLGLVFAVLPKIFSRANKNRGWARAVSDSGTRVFVTSGWNIWHMAYAMGGTATPIYVKWAKQNKLKVLSDDIGEGAKLHWVGPQRFDRVFLFFHGGGFSLPPSGPEQLNFLYQVQRDLQVSVGGAGVAFLEYSLTPDYLFPTQLCQANAAEAILRVAIWLYNWHPTSCILIPTFLPPPTLPSPFGGALLISPWVTYDVSSSSFAENDKYDTMNIAIIKFLADLVRPGIRPEQRAYFEPCAADDAWWTGLDIVFSRIMNTAGEVECLRDPIVQLGETLKNHVKDTTTVVEKNGVHEDVLKDFGVGRGEKSDAYKLDINWLCETFKG
ncbi:hypothetical protein EW146_g7644 [Bondarzewia mesenterica]|uniref:Alpha/beta hydrolase fold-3 domain-containing protein n=1 Tax=Bondarzewia mesenterica TaxID=1095465 RepID=A0A4S4LK85_9AGAM|nr:hypothetical protein EW146_g7644 [Bondarzewia mesenterica]